MIETILFWLSYIGMGVGIVGLHFQSKLEMKQAFLWFLPADILLLGIQVYLHVWPQVILYCIYLYMSSKGLIKAIRKENSETS